jgi:ATP-dependent DNA helicase RecG
LDHHTALIEVARQYADYILNKDSALTSQQGEALRILLYLFENDKAISYLRSG